MAMGRENRGSAAAAAAALLLVQLDYRGRTVA